MNMKNLVFIGGGLALAYVFFSKQANAATVPASNNSTTQQAQQLAGVKPYYSSFTSPVAGQLIKANPADVSLAKQVQTEQDAIKNLPNVYAGIHAAVSTGVSANVAGEALSGKVPGYTISGYVPWSMNSQNTQAMR